MSQAEELLNSVSANNEIAVQTANPETEGHIIVDSNRFITVPDELKRIAVANDHNIETVTFECPRYWDGHDLSQMQFYINYQSPDKSLGCYVVKSLEINPATDGNILHFDWTITRNVAKAEGKVVFLVCAKQVDKDGNEVLHWNSELCEDLYVSEGLECDDVLEEEYPDLYTQLLELINKVNTTYPDMYPKILELTNTNKKYLDDIAKAKEEANEVLEEAKEEVNEVLEEAKEEANEVLEEAKKVSDILNEAGISNGLLYTPNKYHHFYEDEPVNIFSSSLVTKFLDHNGNTIDKRYMIKSLANAECSIWLMANFCRILYRVPLNYELFQDIWTSAGQKVEQAKEILNGFIVRTMHFNLSELKNKVGVNIKPSFKSSYDAGVVYASYDFIDFNNYAKILGKVDVPAIMRLKQPTYDGILEIFLQDIGNFMYNPNYLYPNSDNTDVNFPTYFTVDMTFPCEEIGGKVAVEDLVKNYIEIGGKVAVENYIEISATEVSTQNKTMYSGGVE